VRAGAGIYGRRADGGRARTRGGRTVVRCRARENATVSDTSNDDGALKRDYEQGRLDEEALAQRLSDGWAVAYRARGGDCELVEVDQGHLTYLFDINAARVVGVWGRAVSTMAPRPATRMRGFPLPPSDGQLVRGHLVAHAIGGGTDINLISQSARLNVSGAWRRLERLAQSNPGAFLAIEVGYSDDSQTPSRFTYVLAVDGTLTIESFANA
jgi:DNA/RNA non-specific endonuclease